MIELIYDNKSISNGSNFDSKSEVDKSRRKKNHKNGEILKPERFTEKKNKQNYEQNNDNDCHENDYTDFDINKRSTNIGHNIKRRRRPSLVKSLYPYNKCIQELYVQHSNR